MDATEIRTERLVLKQFKTNEIGSGDLDRFHHIWSDDTATQWSYRGPCNSTEESSTWMAGILPRNDRSTFKVGYAVLHPAPENLPTDKDSAAKEMIGIITLLSTTDSVLADQPPPATPMVEIGYLFHPSSWGHGYATESLLRLLEVYQGEVRGTEKESWLVVGNAHIENKGSLRVMQKLGFREAGQFKQQGRLPLREETEEHSIVHLRYEPPH